LCVRCQPFHCCTSSLSAVAYSGGGGDRFPPLSEGEFLDLFRTVSVSFVSRLNRKIRTSRLPVTAGIFCLLKTVAKCAQTCNFGDKNFSWWEHHHTPLPGRLRRLAPSLHHKYATDPRSYVSAWSDPRQCYIMPVNVHIRNSWPLVYCERSHHM